jgi:hypothetical protein
MLTINYCNKITETQLLNQIENNKINSIANEDLSHILNYCHHDIEIQYDYDDDDDCGNKKISFSFRNALSIKKKINNR